MDVVYLKNVLLKFIIAASQGKIEQVTTCFTLVSLSVFYFTHTLILRNWHAFLCMSQRGVKLRDNADHTSVTHVEQ